MTARRFADVGQNRRGDRRHRRGHVRRRAAEGHAQDVCLGMRVHIRRNIQRPVGIQDDALTDERIHAAAVDHQRNRAVRAHAARSERASATDGIRVLNRLDRYAVVDPDLRVARDKGLDRAVKHGCRHGSADARNAARRRQCRGQHERIVHRGLYEQRFSLFHIARQTRKDVRIDVDRADRRRHARDGARARDGNRPDGAGRQIDRAVPGKRLLQRVGATAVLIAHRRRARPRGNLDGSLRAEHGVVIHLRQNVGIQHSNRKACADAGKGARSNGAGNHVRDQVVRGDHLNAVRRNHLGRAADQRADAVLRIIRRSVCAQIARSRDVRIRVFVHREFIAASFFTRIARRVEFIAAIPVLRIEGMVALVIRAADGDFGLTDAVSLEKSAHVVLAIRLRRLMTGGKGSAHEVVRLEAAADPLVVLLLLRFGERLVLLSGKRVALANQRVARILRHLAARNGHHDRCANADLPRRDRARIGVDVAIRGCVDGDRAGQALDHVVPADARGNRVVDHVDHSCHADARNAAARERRRDRVGGQLVASIHGDGIRPDVRAVIRQGLRGLLEHHDVHRAGHAGSAADGDARSVGRDEFRGIGNQREALRRVDVRVAADDCAGCAFIIGHDADRRNARRAAASHRAGDVEQLVVRDRLDRGIAGRANHAAHARLDVVLEHQRARANRNARRAAARKVERQHDDVVAGHRGDVHVAGRAHKLHRAHDALSRSVQAHAKDRFNRLVIDHDDGGSADARRSAHGSAAGNVD